MMDNVATYSYSALQKCADAVKATSWTVGRKAEHFGKCFEVQKVFALCFKKTDCMLFDPDFSPWRDYRKAVERKAGKKELDARLRECHRFLCRELNGILTMMRAGEVRMIE